MKRFGLKLLGGSSMFLALGLSSVSPAGAAEEYEKFLDGLRRKGYYDVAVDYLDLMGNSPLLTDLQKQMIPFEAARTNLEASRNERDNVNREKLLDAAKAKFQEFVAKNPSHPQAPGAETQMGAVLVERGRAKVEMAVRPEYEKDKAKLMTDARKYFDEAEAVFVAAEKKFADLLATFPKFMTPDDPRVPQREKAKGDLIQAHMFHAKGLYEKSRTFEDQSPDWKKALMTAADKYGSIYREYRTLIAGLAARLQEGQCYQEMKDFKRSLGLYQDLLGQPDDLKPLRPYKASALYLSLQCWTSDSEKLYELATIQADEFLRASNTEELNRPEWHAVRYFGAVANKLYANTFPEGVKGEEEKKKQKALDTAADYAQMVASVTGEYQDLARQLLQDIGANTDPTREPKNFAEAQARGAEEFKKFSAAAAEAKTASEKKDEPTFLAKQKEAEAARGAAMTLFYKAMSMADESTNLNDLNICRYYICYLLYTQNKLYDAAVIGEFLLKYYPNSGGARDAAQIALAGYVNEYQANQDALANNLAKPVDPEYDRKKMYEIASVITKQWKGQKQADDAWYILLEIAINEKNIPEILNTLAGIQESSPIRANAEMRAGVSLWSQYSVQTTLAEGAPSKMPPAELQKLLVDVNGVLEKAYERERPKLEVPAALTLQHADTFRFLCESRIALGQNAKALEVLEDPKCGLLTLIRARNENKEFINKEATQDPIPLETCKLALQAYVLNDKVDEAQKIADNDLKQLMAGEAGGDSKEQLAGTYLNLALRLDKQVERNRANADVEGIKKALKGFTFFLDQVKTAYVPIGDTDEKTAAAVKQYKDDVNAGKIKEDRQLMAFQNGNWVSDNYYKLGLDLLSQKDPAADRAQAIDLLLRSGKLDDVLGQIAQPNSDAQLVVKLRKAKAMRRAGDFVQSVGALADVLLERRNLMEAQIEAAETLVDRAVTKKEPLMLMRAIEGSRPDAKGENIIWGWKKIADTMRRIPEFADPIQPKPPAESASTDVKEQYAKDLEAYNKALPLHAAYRKLFHTGRYNMALCYYQKAQVADSPEDRSKMLNSVVYSINNTADYDPTMGGAEWKPKYDDLKSKAEKALKP